ncbi:MAG: glutamyl-tRNA reductase [Truepera sp.]|nr:glutamyl-tRNA reductase [Truepera sp.]
MERLVLIGVSHRRGGAAALERWQAAFPGRASLGLPDAVLISTCNRWDVVASLPEGLSLTELRRRLTLPGVKALPYAYQGEAAIEQLARIAASLDSLNPGEDQIMNQVREAFAAAQRDHAVGPLTAFAFHTALRIAKRIRREVPLAPLHTSLFSLAKPELLAALPPQATVAILGAGEVGALVVRALAAEAVKLLIVNRSLERAARLAAEVGGGCLALQAFQESPPRVEGLVCATPVGHLVDSAVLDKLPGLKIVIDLGVPRNVAPGAAERHGVRVLDIDSLQAAGARRRATLTDRLAQAEQLVHEELEQALLEWLERQLGPAIKKLRDQYLATIAESLPPEDAARLAHRFAHIPIKGLRALARAHGLEAAQTFLSEAGLT